ncbi:MAG: hypothetical protein PVI23_03155 [Maricaulaceae bacterium]
MARRIMIALLASACLTSAAVAQNDVREEAAEVAVFDPTAGIDIDAATRGIVEAALERAELYAARPDDYDPPRLSNGRPDLQGDWSTATNTPLERAAGFDSLVMTREQAIQAIAQHPQNIRQATDDGQSLDDGLLNGADLARGRGYNAFWIDPGTSYSVVKGEWRTSWITYPEDGRMPPITEEGRALLASASGRSGTGYDNPEERGLGERCVFMSGGPPLRSGLYNNNITLVQTDDHVMIMSEMIHEVRVIRMNAEHHNDGVDRWMGDPIGWWEGDTLVVETTDLHPAQRTGRRLYSEDAVITERFTRWNDHQILYEFEVDDPRIYGEPWGGEISLNRLDGRVYEYACHEGNHGMIGILAGGRQNDDMLEARASATAGQ